jgi:hypothetical protein
MLTIDVAERIEWAEVLAYDLWGTDPRADKPLLLSPTAFRKKRELEDRTKDLRDPSDNKKDRTPIKKDHSKSPDMKKRPLTTASISTTGTKWHQKVSPSIRK